MEMVGSLLSVQANSGHYVETFFSPFWTPAVLGIRRNVLGLALKSFSKWYSFPNVPCLAVVAFAPEPDRREFESREG